MAENTRILFVLDASGSMLAQWNGKYRMDIATETLSKLVDSLKSVPNVELGLRVYGHQFQKKFQNCEDSKLEVPFKKGNHSLITQKLTEIKPKGTTPIAYSLLQAANDFPSEGNYRNVIILITDGIESCDKDPCAISKELQAKDIFLRPFIIGLGDEDLSQYFSCMGKFIKANDSDQLKKALGGIINQTLAKTSVKVELVDYYNKPTETNVNISFINAITGKTSYDFVHFMKNGKSDEINIDQIPTYNVRVNTIPPVFKNNVEIIGGKENLIQIKTPQGSLKVTLDGNNEYKKLYYVVKDIKTGEIYNHKEINNADNYIVGQYQLEVLTLPRFIRKVVVNQSKETLISLPAPGLFHIGEHISGFGSLYKVNSSGTDEWIYNLDGQTSKCSLAIQPGEYKFVFRAENALGSERTDVQKFRISSGKTSDIKLFNK